MASPLAAVDNMSTRRTLAVLLALAGCIAPNHHLQVLDPVPRPSRPVEEVEVLEVEPGRKYRVIAVFSGKDESAYGENTGSLRDKALQHASELGADAVIVTVDVDSGFPIQIPSMIPGVAIDGGTTIFETISRIEARMIVWAEAGPD